MSPENAISVRKLLVFDSDVRPITCFCRVLMSVNKNSKLNFTRYFSNPRAKIKGVNYLEHVVNYGNIGRSFDTDITENTSIRVQEAGKAVRKRPLERILADLDAGYIGVPD